ncbi:MAG: MarR family transcriptional regulator [Pseudomonadales bacterium]|nr:MarR family transcriptional regulator [Pseudomonadales bacterium]
MHFGEMGSRWGFNRTVGQIYALLVLSETPVNANTLGETLGVSRGNVSMAIKELQAWRLVKVQHYPGDRKEYYQPLGTIWDMASTVFDERRKREVDPTLSLLRDILMQAQDNHDDDYALQQMRDIHDLLDMFMRWADELQSLGPDKLQALMKLGSGAIKVLNLKDKLLGDKTETDKQ